MKPEFPWEGSLRVVGVVKEKSFESVSFRQIEAIATTLARK